MGDEYRAIILNAIKLKGPIIPIQIAKELNTNTLMASAMLGEMSEQGLLRISRLKIGGSPMYFAPGQEEQLQNFLKHLNEKDQRTVGLLKEKLVLRDKELEPLTRVSLRQIKDFAKPLEVTPKDMPTEIFWKWYLASDAEAEKKIGQILEPPEPVKLPEVKLEPPKPEPPKQEPVKAEAQSEPKARKKPVKALEPTLSSFVQPADAFVAKVTAYLHEIKISVIETTVVKKNADAEFIIRIPSPVGELLYFCKAKNKKKPSEEDVNQAYAVGQLKNLPVLLLADGELNKKGKEALQKTGAAFASF